MIPSEKNFCGGNFQDWLEVNLIEACNGKCSWCVEKNGFHPKEHAEWWVIVEQALKTNKTNIILLGGEPLLHKDLSKIVRMISAASRRAWITTNGGLLSREYVENNLQGLYGINISIHDFDLKRNEEITGVQIKNLKDTVDAIHELGAHVRFNCNCIKDHVDSIPTIEKYIDFAKEMGADKIRFAELKFDEENFVDLAKVLDYKYGLNDNPFLEGCNSDAVIRGMPVNFRQMCGLQTSRRVKPENPEQASKEVLYYNGKIYKGWQTILTDDDFLDLFTKVANKEMKSEEALNQINIL